MPQYIIITQTAKEYADYNKAKLAEENRRGWYVVILAIVLPYPVVQILWQLHYWGWL